MEIWKKTLCVLLALSALTGCLSGCGAAEARQPAPAASATVPARTEEPEKAAEEPVLISSYITGRSGFFQPEKACTRAEIAQIFSNLGISFPGEQSFTDVAEESWYAGAVKNLSGVLKGYGGGLFRPTREITMAELLTLLCRVQELAPPAAEEGEPWYAPAVALAKERGWLDGLPAFSPTQEAGRAMTVAVCNRALGRVPDQTAIDRIAAPVFLDVAKGDFGYYDILEAAVPHSEDWSQMQLPALAPGIHAMDGLVYYVNQDGSVYRTPGLLEVEGERYLVGEGGRILADEAVHLSDGSPVFCTKDGTLLRNGSWHNLHFDAQGCYTSGDAQLDALVDDLIAKHTTADMDPLEKLYACNCFIREFGYLSRNREYPKTVKIMPAEDGVKFAKKLLETGKGDCYNFAAVFWFTALRLGFDATAVVGYVNYALWGRPYAHGWVEIPFDGVTYLFDPQLENNNWRNGVSNDKFGAFKVTYETAPAQYIRN